MPNESKKNPVCPICRTRKKKRGKCPCQTAPEEKPSYTTYSTSENKTTK